MKRSVTANKMNVHGRVATMISIRRTLGDRVGAFFTSIYIRRSRKYQRTQPEVLHSGLATKSACQL
jgi:hypothetical protein